MSIFNFSVSAGHALPEQDQSIPRKKLIQTKLNGYKLGTRNVRVCLNGECIIVKGKVRDQIAFEKTVLALGNLKGISKVNADDLKFSRSTEKQSSNFHTVAKDENLWNIAEKSYGAGQGIRYKDILNANKPIMTDPDRTFAGQVLRIPVLD